MATRVVFCSAHSRPWCWNQTTSNGACGGHVVVVPDIPGITADSGSQPPVSRPEAPVEIRGEVEDG